MKQWYKIKSIRMSTNTKHGYITVEAAIFLPVFIIGVLTIAYLIKLMAVQDSVFHSLTDEAKRIGSEAFLYNHVPFFEARLVSRVYDENPADVYDVNLKNFQYLKNINGISGIISMNLDYKVRLKLPIQFFKDFPMSEILVYRGFIGDQQELHPMPFTDMEKEEDSLLVWIFPISGSKYHQEKCSCISSEPRQLLLTNQIRHSYTPCDICEPNHISNGNFIYCFIKTGKAYHKGNCPIVDKYVISIEKEEAVKKGYTPCLKCNGG